MTRTSFLELLRVLERHRVDHVLVGGVAAILQGAPITTVDLDFVYRVDDENLQRLRAALSEIEARYRDPARREIAPTVERLRSHRVNLLRSRVGLLDAMQEVGSGWGYADALLRSRPLRVGELEVQVLELAAVIASKEAAGREKDLAALPVLRRTLEMRAKMERDG